VRRSSPAAWSEHDGQVGELLKKLDNLGIADNTIIVYTTDNGAESFSADCGTTLFRSEKNSVGKAAIGCRQWCAGLAPSNPH
jgi:arylsulfatase A-like enzyme